MDNSKWVTLRFELVEYAPDTEEEEGKLIRKIAFDGSSGFQQFTRDHHSASKGVATAREITLLCQLTAILHELGQEESEADDEPT